MSIGSSGSSLEQPFNLRELLARVRAVLRRFDIGRSTVHRGSAGLLNSETSRAFWRYGYCA